jgi:SAM-dependent methyltransferase
MPRAGELTYYEAIGEAGRRHALDKPYSDETRGLMLMQIGAILQLLPPPPARILECGCGTGWLSIMLKKYGYDVVGVDVSPGAIELCHSNTVFEGLEPPEFLVADVESLTFRDEFDAVVFFDALHHSIDEQAAICSAYRALKIGGVCVASETGPAHEKNSRHVVARYDVTEKSMPPRKILRLGRAAGFSRMKVHPRADTLGKCLFGGGRQWTGRLATLAALGPLRYLVALALMTALKGRNGIAVLYK